MTCSRWAEGQIELVPSNSNVLTNLRGSLKKIGREKVQENDDENDGSDGVAGGPELVGPDVGQLVQGGDLHPGGVAGVTTLEADRK